MSTSLPPRPFDVHFTGDSEYHSVPRPLGPLTRVLPSLVFYTRLLTGPVLTLSMQAQLGRCDDHAWVSASSWVARLLEAVGCSLHVEGLEHVRNTEGPCIFVGNHMSTLETFILPTIIRQHRPVTFVVKKGLTTMPLFGPVMRTRSPVVVGRVSARDDLQTVLTEGCERLERGLSVVVFPQSTRAVEFNPARFNSIGVKLAKRSGRPIIPLALQTNAWGQGKKIKDFGRIQPQLAVRFLFGAPITVQDQGKEEHNQVTDFIAEALQRWQKE